MTFDDRYYLDQYYKNQSSNAWMYILAFLIPLLGIILGCIRLSKGEDELGKSLIIFSVVVFVAFTILGALFL